MLVVVLLLTLLLLPCLGPAVMKKPAKGKGYTVRIKGRKFLAASILEKQVEAAQKQFE